MNVWAHLDALVKRHRDRLAELKALASEGKRYLTPRCSRTGVWFFRTRAGIEPETEHHFTDFEQAKAELEVHARAVREARAERLRKRAAATAERSNQKRKRGGVNTHESHVSNRSRPAARAERHVVKVCLVEFEADLEVDDHHGRHRADVRTRAHRLTPRDARAH